MGCGASSDSLQVQPVGINNPENNSPEAKQSYQLKSGQKLGKSLSNKSIINKNKQQTSKIRASKGSFITYSPEPQQKNNEKIIESSKLYLVQEKSKATLTSKLPATTTMSQSLTQSQIQNQQSVKKSTQISPSKIKLDVSANQKTNLNSHSNLNKQNNKKKT